MVLRSNVQRRSSRSLVLSSLVLLGAAWGCSSAGDADSSGTGPAEFTAPAGGSAGASATPAVTPPAPSEPPPPAEPSTEASGGNSETINPVGGLDNGTPPSEPSAGNGSAQEPSGEPPAEPSEPAEPAEPAEPVPPAEPPPVEVFVEDSGLDCAVGALPNNIAPNARVPNPFVKLDGTAVATQADWRCRRKELRSMAERYVFGTKPAKPESVTGNVTGQQISVNVSNQGRNVSFSANVTIPDTGAAPYPAVFAVDNGFGGVDRQAFLAEGVAVIDFDPATVAPEGSRQNKTGAFYTIYGNGPTGLLAAWAWGVSRYIDVIEASDGSVIDARGLAVMGCSRLGKAAFAIGALDERIALSVPLESGTAGVPLYRAVAQAEVGNNGQPSQSLTAAFNEAPWFGDAFQAFLNSANTIPIDTHEIIGLFAPRGLMVHDNPYIGELTARGGHAAALAGVEIFRALGAEASFSYLSNANNGQHCLIRPEYTAPLRQAIRRHLFKDETAAGGTIQTNQPYATANRQDWIDWQTPTLQ
jgi:glucuronyl esterase-like protein